MKKKRIICSALVFLSLSAFAVVSKEQIQSALLGARLGVLALIGNCDGRDQTRMQDLLTLIQGCQLPQKEGHALVWEKQKRCIDTLIQKWSSIEQVACKIPLQRPTERILVKNLLQQWTWVAESTTRDVLETRLNVYLDHLSYWENSTRNPLYLAGDISERNGLDELYQDLSQDLNEVHAEMASGLFNSMRASVTDFGEFQTKKFMEKEPPFYLVMKGLFNQQIPGPISLIHFTAMTLNPLLERAKLFLTLFDLSCSLNGTCRYQDYAYSESYLVLFLTSLVGENSVDGPKLKDALNRLHSGGKEIFETLFHERDKLTRAIRLGMANQEINISNASLEQFEPLAFYLISKLKETEQLLKTVEKTGRFVLIEKEYLGPFTHEGLDQVNQVLGHLKASLDIKLTRYSAHGRDQLVALEQINETVQRRENTTSQLNSIGLELSAAEMDLQALQTALRKEGDVVSKLMLRSSHLISNEAYRGRFASGGLIPLFSQIVNVSARDAQFLPELLPVEIGTLGVSEINGGASLRVRVKKGDLISAEITGQYSPTCAIGREYIGIQNLEDSLTGPEGFIVSSSDRKLSVTSTTKTSGDRQSTVSTDQHTQHLRGCGSTTIGQSISMTAGVSFIASGSVSVSASKSYSRSEDCTDKITSDSKSTEISQANSTTSSSELNQMASFERGMRSQFTPFPAIPVGALVAVELEPGTHQVLNSRVLHRNTVFSSTRDADLILVVNDCRKADSNPAALGVKLTQSRSAIANSVVNFLMETIASISAELQGRLPTFIAQGEISSSDLAVLERDLRTQVNERLISGNFGAFRLTDFPLIDDMVHTWISSELAQLERKIKIRQIERKIQLLTLKYNDFMNQSLNLNRNSIIREMISDSAFRGLDFRELLAEVLRIVQFLDYRILPVLDTMIPGLAKTVGRDFSQFVNAIDLNTDLETVSRRLLSFVDSLNFAQAVGIRARAQSNGNLVISYPRTVPKNDGSEAKYQEILVDGKKEYRSDSSWSAVSYIEANRVWNDFLSLKNELSFKVSELDIYKPSALFGVLNCRQRAPFVSAMGVFFVLDHDQHQRAFNIRNPQRPILLPDVVKIPNVAGMDSYRVTSEAFRSDSVPIRFTTELEVLPVFQESTAIVQNAARGISPIGTFTLQGMGSFYSNQLVRSLLDQVDEILLVFQHDSLSSDRNLSWIAGCSDPI